MSSRMKGWPPEVLRGLTDWMLPKGLWSERWPVVRRLSLVPWLAEARISTPLLVYRRLVRERHSSTRKLRLARESALLRI